LSAGYDLGGKLADRTPNLETVSRAVFAAGLPVLALPTLGPPVLGSIMATRLDGETNIDSQEAEKITAIVLISALVFLILRRKKLL
jgi:hypothetical protein